MAKAPYVVFRGIKKDQNHSTAESLALATISAEQRRGKREEEEEEEEKQQRISWLLMENWSIGLAWPWQNHFWPPDALSNDSSPASSACYGC